METIITRLLEQFEQGKLSRRKLVQSLALTATGAHVLQSAAPAAAESTSAAVLPRTAWLDHIS